jgi:excisionase family DNA binding protein
MGYPLGRQSSKRSRLPSFILSWDHPRDRRYSQLKRSEPLSLLLTREQAAQELAVSTKTIDRLITKGCFKVVRIGKLVRIPFTEVQKFAKKDQPQVLD